VREIDPLAGDLRGFDKVGELGPSRLQYNAAAASLDAVARNIGRAGVSARFAPSYATPNEDPQKRGGFLKALLHGIFELDHADNQSFL